jgi:hypothetical protein
MSYEKYLYIYKLHFLIGFRPIPADTNMPIYFLIFIFALIRGTR